MANYIFIKTRQAIESSKILQELEQVCRSLTPVSIRGTSQNIAEAWPNDSSSFYAIQNSESIAKPEHDSLIIGWIEQSNNKKSEAYSSNADGSYAVIKNNNEEVSFFSDQFGSRTLWYYHDEDRLIVSTSQRAIVAVKGAFKLNKTAIAWYLSSGCQGPFISWDEDIKQVLPNLEYKLNVANWDLDSMQKQGMNLPPSGSTKLSKYLKIYKKQVTRSLKQVINEYPRDQVLLPLSGGFDSRLFLALIKKANFDDKLSLVNWGVQNQKDIFDDKVAAQRVAKYYGKEISLMPLPAEIDNYDEVLNHFVEASEGRIDHFNAFTDGFRMWGKFFQRGYRMILRGDNPYPEGFEINAAQFRIFQGLELLTDYTNINDFIGIKEYIQLQNDFRIERLDGESIIRWRDRLYNSYRVPMVVSAFSQQTSGFVENRTPMFNWSLYKLYMGLSDKEKGDKKHIKKLWSKYDCSKVSSKAVGSLRSMDSYFDTEEGQQYLFDKLVSIKEKQYLSSDLINSVYAFLLVKNKNMVLSKRNLTIHKIRIFLSNHLPTLLKAYLKSKTSKHLSLTTLTYRIILVEKIITMYESDSKQIKVSD